MLIVMGWFDVYFVVGRRRRRTPSAAVQMTRGAMAWSVKARLPRVDVSFDTVNVSNRSCGRCSVDVAEIGLF